MRPSSSSCRLVLPTTLAALTLALLVALPARAADPIVMGQMRMDLPRDASGWSVKDGSGGSLLLEKTFTNEDGDEGAALFQVSSPVTSGAFDANFVHMVEVIPELGEEDPIIEANGTTIAGYPIQMRYVCCGDRDGVTLASSTVGVQLPDAQYFSMLLMLNLDSDQREEAETEFAAAIRTLRPVDQKSAPQLAPKAGDGGLDGVFTTLRTGLIPNAFGGMDFTSESVILAFDPAGLYSTELPDGGATLSEHCATTPTDCGTYAFDGGGWFGGAKSITMADMVGDYGILETETEPFVQNGENFDLDEETFNRIPPLTSDTRFDGTWRYFWASTGSTATASSSVSSERILTMKPDGTFEMTGFSGFMSSMDGGSGTTSVSGSNDKPLENGRYEADGYSLKLVGDNGSELTMSLFLPDIGSDGLLVLNGNNYLKQD